MRRRYPLESLRSLRKEQVDQKKRSLGLAHGRAVQAARAREQAHTARVEEQARAQKVRGAEEERLTRGAVRAWDLSQAGQWEHGASERRRVLDEAESRAQSAERAELRAEERARSELGKSQADSQALEQHHQRWGAVEARALELDEEEQALDRWTTAEHLARAARGKGEP